MPETLSPPPSPALVSDLVRDTARRFAAAGVPDAQVDAELLVAHVLETSRGGVQAASVRGDRMPDTAATALAPLVDRRCQPEPVHALTAVWPVPRSHVAVVTGRLVC